MMISSTQSPHYRFHVMAKPIGPRCNLKSVFVTLWRRFTKTYYDEPGLNYLCESYKKFFLYIRKYLKAITQLIEHGYPASYVMEAVKGPLVINLDKGNK